ncbi:MAG: ABC transporter substrate-binding protein [Lachnospiraceae bacterium]|nr:ABC transporter substrate-binding protein [Lachnospiraceae bacterium]
MSKRIKALCAIGITAALLAGFSVQAKEDTLTIAFSQTDSVGGFKNAETQSIREAITAEGWEFLFADAQASTEKQVSDIEDLISQKPDYLVIAPREAEGLATSLQAAKEAGIPVILVDRLANGEAGVDYVTCLQSDCVWEGEAAAEWLVEATDGKANIVILEGTPGATSGIDRREGFYDVIEEYPDMQVIASQTANFMRAEAQTVFENILQAHGDEITAVYADNDDMTMGAIQAAKAAGYVPGEDIIFLGIDGTKEAVEAIQSGEIGCIVECSARFGPGVVDAIKRLESGETLPTEIQSDDIVFTIDNIEEALERSY